jgi:choline dehydrogenase-like flavoprotein
MITDLAVSPNQLDEENCDVLVIGGGTAGLIVADQLAKRGKHVVVAESGGTIQDGDVHPLNEVVQLGTYYSGAEHGRFRGLGGTSTRWGGAMLPFLESDMMPRSPEANSDWPVALEDFTAHQHDVEQLFQLPEGPYSEPSFFGAGDQGFIARLAKWPSFQLRNVATVLDKRLRSTGGPTIWLNSTVTGFKFNANGRLASVEAKHVNGKRLVVRATEIVLAAGAIESTRLLLLADQQNNQNIFSPDDVLGRYFHDHLSAPTAILTVKERKKLNRRVGFRFEGRGMRNVRFEPSAQLRTRFNLPAGFAHIAFSSDTGSGFDVVRDCYRKLQKREHLNFHDFAALAQSGPWLSRAAWWRYVEKRLLFPDNARFDLHFVTEQEPSPSSRIGLSDARFDVFGCPLATIDWNIAEQDVTNSMTLTEQFIACWTKSSIARLAEFSSLDRETVRNAIIAGGGIYHPGGSVKLGLNPKDGVVDCNLQTFRVPNITVVSTAVFPRGGGANPTMMLLMAAFRAAERLGR